MYVTQINSDHGTAERLWKSTSPRSKVMHTTHTTKGVGSCFSSTWTWRTFIATAAGAERASSSWAIYCLRVVVNVSGKKSFLFVQPKKNHSMRITLKHVHVFSLVGNDVSSVAVTVFMTFPVSVMGGCPGVRREESLGERGTRCS